MKHLKQIGFTPTQCVLWKHFLILIPSSHKHLLSTNYVHSALPGTGGQWPVQLNVPAALELMLCWRQLNHKQRNEIIRVNGDLEENNNGVTRLRAQGAPPHKMSPPLVLSGHSRSRNTVGVKTPQTQHHCASQWGVISVFCL